MRQHHSSVARSSFRHHSQITSCSSVRLSHELQFNAYIAALCSTATAITARYVVPYQIHHQPLHIHSTASFTHSISLLSNLSTRRKHHWHPPAHPSSTSLTSESDSCARCRVPRCRELHDLAVGKARQGSLVETRKCGVAVISTAMLGLGERGPWSSRFRPPLWGLKHFDITLQSDFRERFVNEARETECEAALETGCGSAACATRWQAANETYRVPFRDVRKALWKGNLALEASEFRLPGASPPYPSIIPPFIEPSSIIWRYPVRAERSRVAISVVFFCFLSALPLFPVLLHDSCMLFFPQWTSVLLRRAATSYLHLISCGLM